MLWDGQNDIGYPIALMAIVSAIVGVAGYLLFAPASDGTVMVVWAIAVFAVLRFVDGYLSSS